MIERLEVTPGPGTVIRYGSVAAWASSSASSGLVSFLAVSARNLSGSASGGRQLADHLVGVLESRDPEPNVPFAVVGPTEEGWAALLHGPVQIWDGTRWITPDPSPGWLRCSVWPQPSLAVTFAGASAPPVSPDSLWDLEAGVVPGAGFVLLPAVPTPGRILGSVGSAATAATAATAEPGPAGPAAAGGAEPTVVVGGGAEPTVVVGGGAEPTVVEGGEAGAAGAVPEPAGTEAGPVGDGLAGHEASGNEPVGAGPEPVGTEAEVEGAGAEAVAAGPAPGAEPASPLVSRAMEQPAGVVDLRSPQARSRVVAYPPLPSGRVAGRPVPGSPVVAGVVCRQGHLNRPGMTACVRCGSAITDADAYNVSGTRPALGSLVIDDGSVYRLDTGYLVGSDPGRDPTVRGGLARPLTLGGPQLAPSHAEIRLHDWDVVITDRDSAGGTYLYGPDSNAWERLRPYEPRVLQPGTHIAFGQRVVTFLTPWITGPRPASAGAAGGIGEGGGGAGAGESAPGGPG